jgi:protein-L-isoaspartate(D-aspartate) O-methyltransferase
MVALMTELAELEVGMKVLEVGTGSGYHAAVLAEVVAPSDTDRERWGHVYSIERFAELAERARRNLERTGYSDRVTVLVGDGTLGYPEEAPYDRIVVTAAAPDVPSPLISQLRPGGVMVIPIGDKFIQYLYVVRKEADGTVKMKKTIPVLFVPLVGEFGWKPHEVW